MARPKFAPKVPHPWTRPTYHAKRQPDPIRRFSTMHWTDRRTNAQTDARTHRPTDRPRESLITICRYATTATRPNNNIDNNILLLVLTLISTELVQHWYVTSTFDDTYFVVHSETFACVYILQYIMVATCSSFRFRQPKCFTHLNNRASNENITR